MAASTFEHEPRLTDLYASLTMQWARQTVQYSRSVRLYQERLRRQRGHRPRVMGPAVQQDAMLTPWPAPLMILDVPDAGVNGRSLELGTAPPQAELERPRAGTRGVLTARQREIAGLIAQGLTNSQIAARIVVSRGTVGNHVGHMLRRLGMKNRAQIAAWASRQGTGDMG